MVCLQGDAEPCGICCSGQLDAQDVQDVQDMQAAAVLIGWLNTRFKILMGNEFNCLSTQALDLPSAPQMATGMPNGSGCILQQPRVFAGAAAACVSARDRIVSASGAFIDVYGPRLNLLHTLVWSNAFPVGRGRNNVHCISLSSDAQRIVAASTSHVAVFDRLPDNSRLPWKVAASFHTVDDVLDLDVSGSRILLVTTHEVSVWTMDDSRIVPIWKKEYFIKTHNKPFAKARFSQEGNTIACFSQMSTLVSIFNSTLHVLCNIQHPTPVHSVNWRKSSTLATEDIDGIVRLWTPMIDEPSTFVLWSTIQSSGSAPFRSVWLNHAADNQEFLLQFDSEGKSVLHAIDNIGRKPPTFLKQKRNIFNLPCINSTHFCYFHFLLSCQITTLKSQDSINIQSLKLLPFTTDVSLNVQLIRYRPSQKIETMTRSPRGTFIATLGSRGEVTLWKLRRQRDQVLSAEAFTQYHPQSNSNDRGNIIRPLKLAIWDDGERIVYFSKDELHLLRRTTGPAGIKYEFTHTFDLPHNNEANFTSQPVKVLMPLTTKSKDGKFTYFLLAAYETGLILFWRIKASEKNQQDEPDTITLENQLNMNKGGDAPLQAIFALDDALGDIDPDAIRVVVGCISSTGVIKFWSRNLDYDGKMLWSSRGAVHTNNKNIQVAKASGTKKVAILNTADDSSIQLSIWNSLASEFNTGFEYSQTFSSEDAPTRLDWTVTPDIHPVLAVGFSDRILIYAEERTEYYNPDTKWNIIYSIKPDMCTSFEFTDHTWIWASHIVVSSNNQLHLYNRQIITPNIKSAPSDLFDLVSKHIGPLPEWHPQLLMQCLLAGRLQLVIKILRELQSRLLKNPTDKVILSGVSLEDFLQERKPSFLHDSSFRQKGGKMHISNDFLNYNEFGSPKTDRKLDFGTSQDLILSADNFNSEEQFSALEEDIKSRKIPGLSETEQMHLLITLQTVVQVQDQRRTLDQNGMRYLISMRSFFLYRDLSTEQTRKVVGMPLLSRLRYRDMLWAFYSQSQEILLDASLSACGKSLSWETARALTLPLWLKSHSALESQMEAVARAQFMNNDDKDPVTCSLLYFAMRKRRLVQMLWKQSFGHPERAAMLKFLDNNFDEPRWKTAASKNAYALLSKKRFQFAAAFFVLADKLYDAALVCLRQLNDFQLAITICRLYEGGVEGEIFQNVLNHHILPLAFSRGWRRLASWAFWMIKRRDLSVRVLVTPMSDMTSTISAPVDTINPPYDDPSLALLYLQLRGFSVQTAQGAATVSPRTEFNFALHVAGILCRMGCHVLALDLVRSWPFTEVHLPPTGSPINTIRAKANGETEKDADLELRLSRRRSTLSRSSVLDVDFSKGAESQPTEEKDIAKKDASMKTHFGGERKIVSSEPAPFDFSSFNM